MKILKNPYGVSDSADRICAPDLQTPLWSENLLWWVNDPACGVSIFSHMSRLSPDPRIWEGVLAVTLPDGRILIDRSTGQGDKDATSGKLEFVCVEPHQRWTLRFSGTMQVTSSAELAAGHRVYGRYHQVELYCLFEALHPVWSLGAKAADQDWAHFHIQQGGAMTGYVTMDQEHYQIDATGFRDHSVGPRDYTGLLGNFWACAVFPSGKTFMAFKVWSQHLAQPMSSGFLADADSVEDIEILEASTLTSPAGEPKTIRILAKAGDKTLDVTGTGTCAIIFHLTRPQGMLFGYDMPDPETCIDVHMPMRFELDGEVAYGWLERIRRGDILLGNAPSLT